MSKKKIVLAYSGGLDTSVILKWLVEKDFEVITFTADLGQIDNLEQVKEKALKLGASKSYIMDLKEEFINKYVYPTFQCGAIYENKYLLGCCLARPLIAEKQIEIANKENADYVAHGATGKGNDQVRFELGYLTLKPEIKIFAPWKDAEFLSQFKGRTELLNYAKEHGIPLSSSTPKPYSDDENLLYISHEGGILENPANSFPLEHLTKVVSPENAPDKATNIKIYFDNGIPVKIENLEDKNVVTGSLEIFEYLNKIGGENGVGTVDMVENRFVGVKSRGFTETPGGKILYEAHQDLERIALDREVYRLKEYLSQKLSDVIYNGFWFSPEKEFLMNSILQTQKNMFGSVTVKVYKGNVYCIARESKYSLYNENLVSFYKEGGYNQEDAKGFIRINSVRLVNWALLNKNKK